MQFTVGAVGLGSIAKFWTGLVTWWHAGEPSFSASARLVTADDGKNKLVAVRISAFGPDGMFSSLASTRSTDGCDALSLSAGRAAYKLLFRMDDEHTAGALRKGRGGEAAAAEDAKQAQLNRDTAEQIDAHAAYRQGASVLAQYVRSVSDMQGGQDRRDAVLLEAIDNLEFVQHTFNRDPEHRVYYLEALRMQSVAYAIMGREPAALVVLEELEDATAGSPVAREQQIELEAIYNQAILHWKRAAESSPASTLESAMASILWDRIASRGMELSQAVSVWQLAQLANVNRRDWPRISQERAQLVLDASKELASDLEDRAERASGAQRRQLLLLAQNIHRNYAIAQLRLIAAFKLTPRGPFSPEATPMAAEIGQLVESSLGYFTRSDAIGPATFNVLVTRAYGALLGKNFEEAEQLARLAAKNDATDQYARYIAAEAVLQRHGADAARQYLSDLQLARLDDTSLTELADDLRRSSN